MPCLFHKSIKRNRLTFITYAVMHVLKNSHAGIEPQPHWWEGGSLDQAGLYCAAVDNLYIMPKTVCLSDHHTVVSAVSVSIETGLAQNES